MQHIKIMENDKQNKSVAKTTKSTEVSTTVNSLDRIVQIETIVDKFANSSLAEQFKSKEYPKGEDGSLDLDAEPTIVFNKADMVLCLALGEELGIPPIIALSHGKSLNLQAVKKVERGKKLGLDYVTALEKIYIWGEGSKEIVYTAIEVVNACLTKTGISKTIVQTGKEPILYCLNLINGEREIFNSTKYKDVDISKFTDEQQKQVITSLSDSGFIACNKDKLPTYIAEVKLERWNKILNRIDVISIPYSSQEAIDAGLLKGINSEGETVKGKDNWNKHRATHLIKMSLMIGARLIAPDLLNGIYNEVELDFVKDKVTSDEVEDAIFEEQ